MMWYLVTKNRCVCVCVWLSSAFTTGPVGFCLKKKQRKIGRNCFFLACCQHGKWNAHHPPKKTLLNRQWTVSKRSSSATAILKSSYFRFTQGIDGELYGVGKGLIFFPTWHIPRGERYDLVLCYHMLLCDLQSFIPSYHIYYMKFHYIV